MPLSAGTRLGPYEIVLLVGFGGMGEVYKARDTRLDRTVAVKVLPGHAADRADVRQRFEREARAVASLNHPNICVLHDVGYQDGVGFLVMEFIEGETLGDRIAKGPIPLEQALGFAVQIAGGLDRAHRAGITHRDVKPGNIMLTRDGAKVLDFGLAHLKPMNYGPAAATQSVTTGDTVFGTPQYMAPEQFEGKEGDARVDVWAFGAVLYEMITGQRAFQGGSYASLVAAILAGDPPRMAVKAFGPSRTERLVRRCLEKDPERRYQSMRDIVLDLEAPVVESAEPPKPDHWPWVVAAACAVAFLALAAIAFRQPPPDLPAMALSILPPEKAVFNETAISPDGKLLAFTVTLEGKQQLWIRPLNALTARPLAGTEGATDPFWSPDSRWIGFFARGKLRKIQAAGGPARTLCEAGVSRGGTWNAEGVILFSDVESGLFRVPEEGGARTPVTIQPALGSAHRWPKFLPRGRRFVFEVLDKDDNTSGIYAGSLDTKERARLVGETSSPGYAEGPGGEGYLLCAREGKLVAQRLEGGRGAVTGEAFTVAENVGVDWATGRTRFSVSGQGLLVYEPRGSDQPRLTWVDRAGKRLDAIGEPGDNFMLAHLSPDGKQVAFVHDHDIKVWDLTRGISTRVTFDRALDNYPVWSPDGRSIAFRSNREGTFQLYVKSVGGTGPEELLLKTGSSKTPSSWAAGGRLLLYSETDPKTKEDLWVLPMDGERKPTVLLRTEFNEGDGSFSPDGKWIAYTSDESGKDEVYVQPYPATGVKSRVSKDGGRWPMWRRDGREMYWVDERGTIMSADLGAAPALQPGIPRAVFERRLQNPSDRYAVSGDGQRFLIPLPPVEVDAVRPVTVVQNFLAGAKR